MCLVLSLFTKATQNILNLKNLYKHGRTLWISIKCWWASGRNAISSLRANLVLAD